jgi:hypothetical protein
MPGLYFTYNLPRESVGGSGLSRANRSFVSQKYSLFIEGLLSETVNHKFSAGGIVGRTLEEFALVAHLRPSWACPRCPGNCRDNAPMRQELPTAGEFLSFTQSTLGKNWKIIKAVFPEED